MVYRLTATFLVMVFVASLASAEEDVRFTRRQERIVMAGRTCEDVDTQLPKIEEWTKSIHPEKNCKTKKQVQGVRCVYDITECVPEHVRKYQGENPLVEGPNCFNLALVMKEIVPHLRYSTADEMSFYMREPLCHEVTDKDGHRRIALLISQAVARRSALFAGDKQSLEISLNTQRVKP